MFKYRFSHEIEYITFINSKFCFLNEKVVYVNTFQNIFNTLVSDIINKHQKSLKFVGAVVCFTCMTGI